MESTRDAVKRAAESGHTTLYGIVMETGFSLARVGRAVRKNPDIQKTLLDNKRNAKRKAALQRQEAVKRFIADGHGIMKACELAGVARHCYYADMHLLSGD